jgi:hydrogenase maturation protease
VADVIVVGLGHPDRGDDGVGPAVARRLATAEGVRAVEVTEPLSILDELADAAALVIVDAVRTGAVPGSVLVRDLAVEPLPVTGAPGSGHLMGLGNVLELARELGRLEAPVTLVGVEGAAFLLGTGLSAAVAEAVPEAVRAVTGLVARWRVT